MPTAYMLVGVPGSGKTTWIENQNFDLGNTVILSTDNYIERKAMEYGSTYSEMFDQLILPANKKMEDHLKYALSGGHDIVWDQTNTTAKSRKSKLQKLVGYKKVAVVFPTPDIEEHQRRLDSRPGKFIPFEVIMRMKRDLQVPTVEEGFDEIIFVD